MSQREGDEAGNSPGADQAPAAEQAPAADEHTGEEWLSTGDMARLGETTLRTVRFYEAEGLIQADKREDEDHRRFPPSELKKLQIIGDLRDAGMSLQAIKSLIALKSGCTSAKQAATSLDASLCACMGELTRRIATMERVRSELASTREMLRHCGECQHPDFPARCNGCEHVSPPEIERATQLLWKN